MKLYDYTNGLEPKFYARTNENIGFVFSSEDDLSEHLENEVIFFGAGARIKSGSIDSIIGKYQIIEWQIKEANERKG